MTTDFNSFCLNPELTQAITELGFSEPTPIQSAIVPLMLAGNDVIGQAQTGTGKTAAYALPILQNLVHSQNGVGYLIVVPTRELALQVSEALQAFAAHLNVRILAVYGGQPYRNQLAALHRGVDIVVGTPGRLLDLIQREALKLSETKVVVLDEADEMLSMGFIDDIESLLNETPPERQTALFSATMPPQIRKLAERYLRNPQSVKIQQQQMTVAAIEQRYYLVNESDKTAALTRLFEVEPITRALIFTRTRVSSGELANELTVRGFPSEVLNGDLTQEVRERVLNRFRQDQVKVLVATDVAARGLDIDGISHVINYDLPGDDESYVHRIGRTGRAGKTGIAISLITPQEQWRLRRIESFTKQKLTRTSIPTEEDIKLHREQKLLGQMKIWLQRNRFKREKEMVQELVDAGMDPMDIAAAALKVARAEEKQRPIDSIHEVIEVAPRQNIRGSRAFGQRRGGDEPFSRSREGRPEHFTRSHEVGMVRMAISQGRVQGIRPNDVVSTIAYVAEIPGSTIGKISIQDELTFVDIPEEFVPQVLAKAGNYKIHRQPVQVQLASSLN